MSDLPTTRPKDLPQVGAFLTQAQAFEIDDQDTYDLADAQQAAFENAAATWDARRKEVSAPLTQALNTLNGWFKPVVDDARAAAAHLKNLKLQFANAQERIRRDAEKAAEVEAKRLRDAHEAAAREAAASGDEELAADMREAAQSVTAVAAVPAFVPAPGSFKRVEKRGRVTDMQAFLRFVADNETMRGLVEVKEGRLNDLVKLGIVVPGTEMYDHEIAVQRRRS